MFSYSPNFYQERLQRLVVRCISICHAVIRHLQGSKLTRDMMVMKAMTALCCRVRSAAPEIQSPTEQKKGQFSIHFCSILCTKYIFSFAIKRYVIMFLNIKIDFWHGRSGTADRERSWLSYRLSTYWKIMTGLKKQRWLLSAGVFRLADFPQKQQECFSEDHDRFISVDSVGRE